MISWCMSLHNSGLIVYRKTTAYKCTLRSYVISTMRNRTLPSIVIGRKFSSTLKGRASSVSIAVPASEP